MIGIRPAMLTSYIRVSWRGTPFRWASSYRRFEWVCYIRLRGKAVDHEDAFFIFC